MSRFEIVYYEDGAVRVTDACVVVKEHTYRLSDIDDVVRKSRFTRKTLLDTVKVIGLVLFGLSVVPLVWILQGPLLGFLATTLGLVLLIIVFVYVVFFSRDYVVVFSAGTGQVEALNTDDRDYADGIVDAIRTAKKYAVR